MAIILIFTIIGSVLFIGAYYVLVRRYYWGTKTTREKSEEDKAIAPKGPGG
jgi:hypothetical protein